MSEYRQPQIIWETSLPGNKGKKQAKIELFSASLWREYAMDIKSSNRFSPKVPLQLEARNEYFHNRYRVRLNGKFIQGNRGAFLTFTKQEIFERFLK